MYYNVYYNVYNTSIIYSYTWSDAGRSPNHGVNGTGLVLGIENAIFGEETNEAHTCDVLTIFGNIIY
jgi:hypothetical protein